MASGLEDAKFKSYFRVPIVQNLQKNYYLQKTYVNYSEILEKNQYLYFLSNIYKNKHNILNFICDFVVYNESINRQTGALMFINDRQRAELELAHSLGVIPGTDDKTLQEMMREKNSKDNAKAFGKTSYDEVSFVKMILARFRVDFVFEKTNYNYRSISDQEIEDYYRKHIQEFLRENKEYFPLEEMKLVCKKRLRELEYEVAVYDLLH